MSKKCIFFVKDNTLYTKTVEAIWDIKAIDYSKEVCGESIFSMAEHFMQPCIDVSSNSKLRQGSVLNVYNVKNSNGVNFIKHLEVMQADPIAKRYPDSCYDLVYLRLLNEKQVRFALSAKSFYDIYYNPDKSHFSVAKALAVLQLLYKQNKLDYLEDTEKFVWWYYINGRAIEWFNKNK